MVGQPARVGRGLRTIAINLSKMAKESATFEAANGKVNISLQKENGEMRSTYEILQQLGEVWGTLNETEQTSIATTIAGKTQFETFANIMKNWGTAAKVVDKATKANGSSLKENEKYLDSIEGKIQAFQSAWEQLSYHVMSSDFIKGVIDLGTDLIKILDTLVQKIGTIPTLLGMLGTAFGAMKLGKLASSFLGITNAIEGTTEATEAVTTAASAASGAKGLGGLSKVLGVLTNPAVLGGLAALAVAVAAIEFDKYFSFDSSLKRLNEYEDKLQDVTSEIDALNEKRANEGLTNAEKTHLAVLEAEERSLERQIKLEQQRVQNAFKKDVSTNQGKKYQERTGPTQLLDYQDARKKELDLDKQILDMESEIADARKRAQYYRMTGDEQAAELFENTADAYGKRLDKLYDQYVKLDAEAAEASANLGAYWEQVSSSVDYDALSDVEKEKFDEIHKAFIESQIDASNLKDSYTDVASVINSAMDSLGHDNLDLFDNIDISSIETVEDAISAIKEQIQGLDKDTELTFKIKNADGEIEEVTKKVSELTDKDYEAMIHFNESGIDGVNAEANNAARTRDSLVKVAQEGAQAVSGVIDTAAKDRDTTVKVKESGAGSVRSTIDALTKPVTTIVNIVKNVTTKQSAKGKRKGEQGGLSWLGDEGSAQNPKPELVVGENGAYLAGTGGWELYNLKSSDTVYTASQTKKLLDGSQIFSGSVGELPRFKKGKKPKKKATAATNANVAKAQAKVKNAKSKKAKKKAKKNLEKLKKKRDKTRSAFDKELEQLKHKAKVNHWTDAKYQSEYQKLYNKYEAYLSGDQSDDYTEAREDYENEVVKADFDRRIGNIAMGQDSLASLISDINNSADLSTDEKTDAIADAYKASVNYNLKEYQNGKDTRDKVLQDIQNYYATRGKYDEEYYKMLDELRKADKEKEIDRLKELQKAQENRLSLAEKYIQKELNSVKKQIDAEKEELELEKDLAQAKNKRIRIYREGQGFVYEEDVEAIQEAQKVLEKTPLEQRAEELQAILDLFDEIADNSAIRELEVLLGVSGVSGVTGGLTTESNLDAWTNWIKNVYASSTGYADLIEKLEKIGTSDINSWLTANGGLNVSDSVIAQYINNHSFASGTLSAPGGLSRVAERLGGELVWLGKGDSVYSNAVSRNLMEWGRYNPAQVMSSGGFAQSQVFNFDKIVLPNVHNAQDFYRELQNLPNKALQQSSRRV